MNNPVGVSIIIPTCRSGRHSMAPLESVCRSAARLPTSEREVILCVDRPVEPNDPLYTLSERFPFVKVISNPGTKGAPGARMSALAVARYDALLFTDDDCLVPADWADRLLKRVFQYGIVTGGVTSSSDQIYSKFEKTIDRYRLRARDTHGATKFVSFPNMGILRSLLPAVPFDSDFKRNADDMDFGCRIRLNGFRIHADETLTVQTEYPKNLVEIIRRKLRHAEGISYVHRRLGEAAWKRLEFGTHSEIFRRWIQISLKAPFDPHEKLLFMLVNLTYVFGLIYYYRKLRSVSMEQISNLKTRLPASHTLLDASHQSCANL